MALAPTQLVSTPYEDYAGYWLKFYTQGTTTPITMDIDGTSGTSVAKAEISSGGTVPIGFIKTTGNVIFIPYVDEAYDAWLFSTEALADANDTSSPAVQIANNLGFLQSFNTDGSVATYAALKANTGQVDNEAMIVLGGDAEGDGAGGTFWFDSSSSATADDARIIAPDVGSGRWLREYTGEINFLWWVPSRDGTGDNYTKLQAFLDLLGGPANTIMAGYIPFGLYKVTDTPKLRETSNAAAGARGNWTLRGDGRPTVIYQVTSGKHCLEIGGFDVGAVSAAVMEGITLKDMAFVGTTGTDKGLYINGVVRSSFARLWIAADTYDLFLEGCLINNWEGIKLGIPSFNEEPTTGITLPTNITYGLYVSPSNQAYTTNAFNGLVIEGHKTGGMFVEGGSTNSYNNIVCEGELGYGIRSTSEWDVFNGLYFEGVTGHALELKNTQKITINGLFSNRETVFINNAGAQITESRADFIIGQCDNLSMVGCDGSIDFNDASINGTNSSFVSCNLYDRYHKTTITDGMSGGTTASFSSNAPRPLTTRITYTQAPLVLAQAGDKVMWSEGNSVTNLGPRAGGYEGLMCTARNETTISVDEASGQSQLSVAATTNMRVGDVVAINNGKAISAITKADPAVVTTTQTHGLANGARININGVNGMTQVNGLWFTVANQTSTTFELSGIDSSAYGAWTSAGVANTEDWEFDTISAIGGGPDITLTGTTSDTYGLGADVFVYRWDLFGKVCGFQTLDTTATPQVVNGGGDFDCPTGTDITTFDDGLIGQEITLYLSGSRTLTNGSTLQLAGGVDFVGGDSDVITLKLFTDSVWYEKTRSVN